MMVAPVDWSCVV